MAVAAYYLVDSNCPADLAAFVFAGAFVDFDPEDKTINIFVSYNERNTLQIV